MDVGAKQYRLFMGFPDGHTDIQFKGKPASDAARMYALGNSWPLNCVEFVLGRIDLYVKGGLQ